MKCNREVRENFKRAYRYIKAAYLIYEDSSEMIKSLLIFLKLTSKSRIYKY